MATVLGMGIVVTAHPVWELRASDGGHVLVRKKEERDLDFRQAKAVVAGKGNTRTASKAVHRGAMVVVAGALQPAKLEGIDKDKGIVVVVLEQGGEPTELPESMMVCQCPCPCCQEGACAESDEPEEEVAEEAEEAIEVERDEEVDDSALDVVSPAFQSFSDLFSAGPHSHEEDHDEG